MQIVFIRPVKDNPDPPLYCKIPESLKQMAFTQITAVYRIMADFLLFQFIYRNNLMNSAQLLRHTARNL